MKIEEFQVKRNDLAASRVLRRDAPPLAVGEVLAHIDCFALTANNVTYGVVGERIGYWKFFPANDGYGIVPVWGFADVVESACPDIEPGERLYGYFPMATHLVMKPAKVRDERLLDGSAHRADLPPVYNAYARVKAEREYDAAMEDVRMLLFPLYATSYCLYDFLLDNKWFGAEQALIVSASSKTAIGLAYALKADFGAPRRLGLTSARNADRVRALKLYDDVATYDALDVIPDRPTVIIDMSGDGKVLGALHRRLGGNMKYTSNVGVTHYDAAGMASGFIHERSAMFFAPSHIQKRAADWGPGVFDRKAFDFWRDAASKSRSWLTIDRRSGFDAIEDAWREVLGGRSSPERGIVVSL
ncbi:MAG: DUF2855 family protein [Parvularculaceae bacterium]|nr:DUF2855 family protein [Parvularculaceae bacterium]